MDSTISSVSAVVIQDSFYWSAHAVINGRLTTASCMHNHKREELAEKCLSKVEKRWDAIEEARRRGDEEESRREDKEKRR